MYQRYKKFKALQENLFQMTQQDRKEWLEILIVNNLEYYFKHEICMIEKDKNGNLYDDMATWFKENVDIDKKLQTLLCAENEVIKFPDNDNLIALHNALQPFKTTDNVMIRILQEFD